MIIQTGGEAIIGGYVYRGTLNPAMYGHYIFADEVSHNVWLLPPGGGAADTIEFKNILTSISSFGEAENGELYTTSLNGQLYQVLATTNGALPVKLVGFAGIAETGYNDISWQTTDEQQLRQFELEYSTDGQHFEQAGIVNGNRKRHLSFQTYYGNTQEIVLPLKDGRYRRTGGVFKADNDCGKWFTV